MNDEAKKPNAQLAAAGLAALQTIGLSAAPVAAAAADDAPVHAHAQQAGSGERARESFSHHGHTLRVAFDDPASPADVLSTPGADGPSAMPALATPAGRAPDTRTPPPETPTAQPHRTFDKYARHVAAPAHHPHVKPHPKPRNAPVHHHPVPSYCREEIKPYVETDLVRQEGPSPQITVSGEYDQKTHKFKAFDASGVMSGGVDYGLGSNDPNAIPGMKPADAQKLNHFRVMPPNEAGAALTKKPEFITPESAASGWRYVTDHLRAGVVDRYEHDSGHDFHSLPTSIQKAVISENANLGALWEKRPEEWGALVQGDMKKLSALIREDGARDKPLTTRRNEDAADVDHGAACIVPPARGGTRGR